MTKLEEKALALLRDQETPLALENASALLRVTPERAFAVLESLVFAGRAARVVGFVASGRGSDRCESQTFWLSRRNWETTSDSWTFDD